MKYFILILIIISLNSFSQNSQKLDENNGFREIKLGSEINNYEFAIERTSTNGELFNLYVGSNPYYFGTEFNYYIDTKHENYNKLGNAKILGIFLNEYKGKILQIKVIVEFRFETFDLMKLAYGDTWNDKASSYNASWSSKNVFCSLNALIEKNKKTDISIIDYVDRLLDEEFQIEKRAKEKAEFIIKQRKAASEF